MAHFKKYQAAKKQVDAKKLYSIAEGVNLAKKISFTKFDSSIDLAIKLNVDPTKPEQQLRGSIALPHYFGKQIRLLVLDDAITSKQAQEAGIDHFGTNDKIVEIKQGWLDFDLIIAHPKFMPELSKLGKILGPKGLMPNPKMGTVSMDTIKTAKEFKKGKLNYKTDTYGNIHVVIGKVSASAEKIIENIKTFIDYINSKRPSTVKGEFIQKICLSSSMGPAIKLAIQK